MLFPSTHPSIPLKILAPWAQGLGFIVLSQFLQLCLVDRQLSPNGIKVKFLWLVGGSTPKTTSPFSKYRSEKQADTSRWPIDVQNRQLSRAFCHACASTCMIWGAYLEVRGWHWDVFNHLSTLLFETGSLTETGAHRSSCTGPMSPQSYADLCPPAPRWYNGHGLTQPLCVDWDPKSVFMPS